MKNVDFKNYLNNFPNKEGYFGKYGGNYTPNELTKPLQEITKAYLEISQTPEFVDELSKIRKTFQGRPTPVYYCERLSKLVGNLDIYLKREDLNHSGAHKINHCMGEGLLAKYLGKKKLIAETGAGQHGVAIATAAAYFGLECDVYMGEVDIEKQAPNVARMKVLGANIIPVSDGAKSLKESVDSAFSAYLKEYNDAIYCIGSVVGPHPFPMMVRDFQKIVGIEAREQFLNMTGKTPNIVAACVGGGSNAAGIFAGFLNDTTKLVGIEPLGKGSNFGLHAASVTYGEEGIMHGFNSLMLKDNEGNPAPVYSIASGLDYPAVGPEHAFYNSIKRVEYTAITDDETLEAFKLLSRYEGIIPALESAHAVAYAIKLARNKVTGDILVNLSGRGDKDIDFLVRNYPEILK